MAFHPCIRVASSSLRQGLCALPRLDRFPAACEQTRCAVFLAHVEVVFARSHWERGFEDFDGEAGLGGRGG
jgi:hypothetical protein